MPVVAKKESARFKPTESPSILLASDRERLGSSLHQVLCEKGFQVAFAGDYSGLEEYLHQQRFDMVLLEVSGEHAVEAAVQTALRVKRGNAGQFVGYLADPALAASGLAGDAIFPRSPARLPETLHRFFSEESGDA
jgi:hypothetical protein